MDAKFKQGQVVEWKDHIGRIISSEEHVMFGQSVIYYSIEITQQVLVAEHELNEIPPK